ncbi:MAG TPA: PRC-barrel domain-containing protein [Egibacteraceae bacterium]|nr:PRC-barrel domain-containing protein [Egibacteraceae bacterium]
MTLLVRAGDLIGRPVVTLDTAEDVAEVKDVVFRHAEATVVGFTLNKRGRFAGPLKEVLPWSRVAALGRDAVMIESRDALGPPDEPMGAASGGSDQNIIGTTVMTEAGKALGTVRDLVLEVGRDADVVGFEITDGGHGRLLPVDDTFSVSREALMVPAAAEEFIHDDISGFGSAVGAFRERLRRQDG